MPVHVPVHDGSDPHRTSICTGVNGRCTDLLLIDGRTPSKPGDSDKSIQFARAPSEAQEVCYCAVVRSFLGIDCFTSGSSKGLLT